jgi:hypothetical protein
VVRLLGGGGVDNPAFPHDLTSRPGFATVGQTDRQTDTDGPTKCSSQHLDEHACTQICGFHDLENVKCGLLIYGAM